MICLICFDFFKVIMHCDLLSIHYLKSSMLCAVVLFILGVVGKFHKKS